MIAKRRREPQVIVRGGKPEAVILDINEYEDILERLEDAEDLAMLREMRKKPLSFRKRDDFLWEQKLRV